MTKKSQKNGSSSDASSNSDNQPKIATKPRTRRKTPRHSPQRRSSIYRGVTRHRWTGRYEAHLWDKDCWNESQSKKGRQVYLGAYGDEEAAAHAYDLAALKYWGHATILNFPLSTYEEEIKEMEGQSREEYIGSLRRRSSGFSRGVSKYRGVARHHHNGRWEARIGRVFGNKYLYLGTYATQEEAAIAYDMAAIEYRGLNAVTNFDLSRYIKWLHPMNQDNPIDPIVEYSNPHGDADTSSLATPNDNEVELGFGLHHSSLEISNDLLVPPRSNHGNGASSALELLQQSPKFKRLLERTSGLFDHPPKMKESDDPPRRTTFPDDIQTLFDCHDSSCYTQSDHDNIFSAFHSFEDPAFDCELHA